MIYVNVHFDFDSDANKFNVHSQFMSQFVSIKIVGDVFHHLLQNNYVSTNVSEFYLILEIFCSFTHFYNLIISLLKFFPHWMNFIQKT